MKHNFGAKFVAFGMACGLLTAASSYANAVTYSFINITGNSATDAAAGQSQLSVDVTALDGTNNALSTQALFTFNNVGPDAMSITDVYFDDGTLLGIAALYDSDDELVLGGGFGDAGVDFSQGASPGNLPGANNAPLAPFATTAGFSADSDPPAQPNGVNPGESFGILFNLLPNQNLGSIYNALLNPCFQGDCTGDLRIGIHVQGFAGGGSESFVNIGTPLEIPPQIPLPAALPLFLSALGAAGFTSWRRRRKQGVAKAGI